MTMAIIWYTLLSKHWAPAEFLAGALIAEFGLIQEEYTNPHAVALDSETDLEKDSDEFRITFPSSTKHAIGRVWRIFWWCLLALALYVCGWPRANADKIPFIPWLQQRSPDVPCPDTFWFIPTAVVVVGACHQLAPLQKILTTPFVQYWASISYASLSYARARDARCGLYHETRFPDEWRQGRRRFLGLSSSLVCQAFSYRHTHCVGG